MIVLCNSNLWVDVIPNWLSAIGTCGAVVVALFHKSIKNYVNRPKIDMIFEQKKPYVENVNCSTQSSTPEEQKFIRVRLKNDGKNTAEHSLVVVDHYFEKRNSESSYCEMPITPIQIKDYKNSIPSFVNPHIDYYLNIASICKIDEMSTSTEEHKYHQFYKLFLLGDKLPVKLGSGTGTFIIPIKFCSPRLSTKVFYLKIYWDSTEMTDDTHHFYVKMLSEIEFNNETRK